MADEVAGMALVEEARDVLSGKLRLPTYGSRSYARERVRICLDVRNVEGARLWQAVLDRLRPGE